MARLVVVGGDAAGMTAASYVRRAAPDDVAAVSPYVSGRRELFLLADGLYGQVQASAIGSTWA